MEGCGYASVGDEPDFGVRLAFDGLDVSDPLVDVIELDGVDHGSGVDGGFGVGGASELLTAVVPALFLLEEVNEVVDVAAVLAAVLQLGLNVSLRLHWRYRQGVVERPG